MKLAGVSRATVVGWLELLWHATAEFAPRGDIGKCSDAWIEAQLDWRGKRGKLVQLLIETRWLLMNSESRLIINDWHEHADDSVRRRLARSGLSFATVTAKVAEKTPSPDGNLSGACPENVGLPEPSHSQSLAIAKPSHSRPSVDSAVDGPPPPETELETGPATDAICSMLMEFTRGRLGTPDNRICLKLLHYAGGEVKRVDDWLVSKAKRRDQFHSWGFFLQAGEAELLAHPKLLPMKLAQARSM